MATVETVRADASERWGGSVVPPIATTLQSSSAEQSQRDKEFLALIRLMSEESSCNSLEEECTYFGLTFVLLAAIAHLGVWMHLLRGAHGPLFHGPWLVVALVGFLFSQLFPTGRAITLFWIRELASSAKRGPALNDGPNGIRHQ